MTFNTSALVDLLLFIATLFFAWFLKWTANDLVWSLWVSSLTIGYISLIFGPIIVGIRKLHWRNFFKDLSSPDFRKEIQTGIQSTPKKNIVGVVLIGGTVAIFLIAFFTIHFGMFHFVHGVFLSSFFPIEGMKYPNSPWDLPRFAIVLAFIHWQFVVASAISQFFRLSSKAENISKNTDIFFGPYKAVIRMHLMIFVFAFLQMMKADHFIFYAVTLFAYFFPWQIFRKNKVLPNSSHAENIV